MSFIFDFFNGNNRSGNKNNFNNGKRRSLRLEALESRELLNVGPISSSLVPEYGTPLVAESSTVQTKAVEATSVTVDYESGLNNSCTLTWRVNNPDPDTNYTFTIYRNKADITASGSITYTEESGVRIYSFTDSQNVPNKVYYVYAKNTTTGSLVGSPAVQVGTMFNATLNARVLENGNVELEWDNQQSSAPNTKFYYQIVRNNVVIRSNLTDTKFVDTDPTSGSTSNKNEYVLYIFNEDLNLWSKSKPAYMTLLEAPEITNYSTTQDSITVTWELPEDVDGAKGVHVDLYDTATGGLIGTKTLALADGSYTFNNGENGYEISPNTMYLCKVTLIPDGNAVVATPAEQYVTTLAELPAPTISKAKNQKVTADSITVSWTPPTGEMSDTITGYELQWRVVGGTWSSTIEVGKITETTITVPNSFTEYEIRIRSVSTTNHSKYDSTTQKTALSPPTSANAASYAEGEATITWVAPVPPPGNGTGAGYRIEYTTNGTWTDYAPIDVGPGNSVDGITGLAAKITGLEPLKTYSFRITTLGTYENNSRNSVTGEVFSTTILAHALAPPTSLTATANGTSVKLEWPAVVGDDWVEGYLIEYISADANGDWSHAKEVKVTGATLETITIDNLDPGTYTFRISSTSTKDGAGPGGYAETKKDIVIKTAAPDNLAVTAVKADSVTLTWDPVPDADGYYLIRYGNNAIGWKELEVSSGTEATIGGLSSNTKYTFEIYTADSRYNEISDSSSIDQWTLLKTPELDSATSTAWDKVLLTWSPVDGANRYVIEYVWNTSSKGSVTVDVTDKDLQEGKFSYSVTVPNPATTYAFTIQAVNATGKVINNVSEVSDSQTATTSKRTLSPPKITGATASENSITLYWDAVDGTTLYEIQYAPAGTGNWMTSSNKVTWTDTGYTLTGLTYGASYDVQIRALSLDADSVISSTYAKRENVTTQPQVPVVKSATNVTDKSITLNWEYNGNQSTKFKLQYEGEDGKWHDLVGSLLGAGTRSCTFSSLGASTPLEANKEYKFQIQAVGDNTSDWVDFAPVTTKLAAPTLTATIAGSNSVTLSGTVPKGDFTHLVLEWEGGTATIAKGDAELIYDPVTGSYSYSYKATGLAANTAYNFKARTELRVGNEIRNRSVDVVVSESVTTDWIKLDNPEPNAESRVELKTSADGYNYFIDVTWNAVAGAAGYSVEWAYAGTPYGGSAAGGYTTNVKAAYDANTQLTTYSYTISLFNNAPLPSGSEYVVWVTALGNLTDTLSSGPAAVGVATQVEAPKSDSFVVDVKIGGNDVTKAKLSWTAGNEKGVDGYRITFVDDNQNKIVFDVPKSDSNSGKYTTTATGLVPNTKYTVTIVAYSKNTKKISVEIPESITLSTIATTRLAQPTNVKAVAQNSTTILVSWEPVTGANGYRLEWMTKADFENAEGGWETVVLPVGESGVIPSTATEYAVTVEAGETYVFRLWAFANANGAKSDDVVINDVSAGIDAPANLQITAIDSLGNVTLGWTKPGATDNIKWYEIEYTNKFEGGEPVWEGAKSGHTTNATANSLTIAELLKGSDNKYAFRIRSVSNNADIPNSEWFATIVMTNDAKLPPSNLKATVNGWNSVILTWDPAVNVTGGYYQIEYATNLTDWTVIPDNTAGIQKTEIEPTKWEITGLVGAESYEFRVCYVCTDLELSKKYTYTSITTALVDLPPAIITKVDGDTVTKNGTATVAVNVTWTYPTSGVNPAAAYAEGFEVQYRVYVINQNAEAGWITYSGMTVTDKGGGTYEGTIAGLLPDTKYEFRVIAKGDVTKSTPSTPSELMGHRTKVVAPWNLKDVAASNGVTLTWTEQPNQASIQYYRIQQFDGVDWVTIRDNVAMETNRAIITGLNPSEKYEFRVVGVYKDGAVEKVTPESMSDKIEVTTLPKMLGAITATPNGDSIKLDWTAVTDAVAGAVSAYIIYDADGNEIHRTADGTTYTYTVPNLDPVTTYKFSIAVLYANGKESSKRDVEATTTRVQMNRPTIAGITNVTETGLTVSWTVPINQQTPYLAGYEIEYTTDPTWQTWSKTDTITAGLDPDATAPYTMSYTFGDVGALSLDPGTKYYFRLVAVGNETQSINSDASTAVTKTTFTNISDTLTVVSVVGKEVNLSWTAPTPSTAATGIVGYVVYYIAPGGSWDNPSDWKTGYVGSDLTATVMNLDLNKSYEFRVHSYSYYDTDVILSRKFAEATVETGPEAATILSAVEDPDTPGAVTVNWDYPIGVTSHDGFRVTWKIGNQVSGPIYVASNVRSHEITDLLPGSIYTIEVSAVSGSWNTDGFVESASSTPATKDFGVAAKKVAIDSVKQVVGKTEIEVKWLLGNSTGVASYTVTCYEVDADGNIITEIAKKTDITVSRLTWGDLDPGKIYCFEVVAIGKTVNGTKIGDSQAAKSAPVKIENVSATAPTNLAVAPGSIAAGSVKLTWDAAPVKERSSIVSYRIDYAGGSVTVPTKNSDPGGLDLAQPMSYVVMGLSAETNYTFTVTAITAADAAYLSSGKSEATPGIKTEAGPTTVSKQTSWTSMKITWKDPNNVAAVYEVQYWDESAGEWKIVTDDVTITTALDGITHTATYKLNSSNGPNNTITPGSDLLIRVVGLDATRLMGGKIVTDFGAAQLDLLLVTNPIFTEGIADNGSGGIANYGTVEYDNTTDPGKPVLKWSRFGGSAYSSERFYVEKYEIQYTLSDNPTNDGDWTTITVQDTGSGRGKPYEQGVPAGAKGIRIRAVGFEGTMDNTVDTWCYVNIP